MMSLTNLVMTPDPLVCTLFAIFIFVFDDFVCSVRVLGSEVFATTGVDSKGDIF